MVEVWLDGDKVNWIKVKNWYSRLWIFKKKLKFLAKKSLFFAWMAPILSQFFVNVPRLFLHQWLQIKHNRAIDANMFEAIKKSWIKRFAAIFDSQWMFFW